MDFHDHNKKRGNHRAISLKVALHFCPAEQLFSSFVYENTLRDIEVLR